MNLQTIPARLAALAEELDQAAQRGHPISQLSNEYALTVDEAFRV